MCLVNLKWTHEWSAPPAPHLLRGAIAAAFPENDLFHQHNETGTIYRYPRIHYRWDTQTGDGILAGFGPGVEALGPLFAADLQLRLGERAVTVAESNMSFVRHRIKLLPKLKRYHFRSPWLPLNQENYGHYQSLNRAEQSLELDRIAVGNILSALKGLNIRVEGQVYAAIQPKQKLWCSLKGQKLCGLLGTLLTNIDLPDDFALGKAVSHGYGWIASPMGATAK
jgi:hypothetical protein